MGPLRANIYVKTVSYEPVKFTCPIEQWNNFGYQKLKILVHKSSHVAGNCMCEWCV